MKKEFALLLYYFWLHGIAAAQTLLLTYESSVKLGERANGLPLSFVNRVHNMVVVSNYRYADHKSDYRYEETRVKNPNIPKLYSKGEVLIVPCKDFNSNFMYQSAEKFPGSVSREPLKKDQKWEIQKDTSIIMGYKCIKATLAEDSTSIVTAWYASDIAISDGPASYYGLPGMILRVESDNYEVIAVQIAVNSVNEQEIKIEIPHADQYLTREAFDILVRKPQ